MMNRIRFGTKEEYFRSEKLNDPPSLTGWVWKIHVWENDVLVGFLLKKAREPGNLWVLSPELKEWLGENVYPLKLNLMKATIRAIRYKENK